MSSVVSPSAGLVVLISVSRNRDGTGVWVADGMLLVVTSLVLVTDGPSSHAIKEGLWPSASSRSGEGARGSSSQTALDGDRARVRAGEGTAERA
jgi:hypothetical protein